MAYIVLVNPLSRSLFLRQGVGILGRWQDGTEPPGRGVTGPFWLWPSVRDATNPLEDSFGLHHFADSPGASSEAASDDMF